MRKTNGIHGSDPLQASLLEHGTPRLRIGPIARGRILASVRSDLAARGVESRAPSMPALSLAAACLSLLILSVGFFMGQPGSVPFVSAGPDPQGSPDSAPSDLWVDYEEGKVVLTWKGAAEAEYAVRQAGSIPEARTASAVHVRGSAYIQETLPEMGQAVFYVVE